MMSTKDELLEHVKRVVASAWDDGHSVNPTLFVGFAHPAAEPTQAVAMIEARSTAEARGLIEMALRGFAEGTPVVFGVETWLHPAVRVAGERRALTPAAMRAQGSKEAVLLISFEKGRVQETAREHWAVLTEDRQLQPWDEREATSGMIGVLL